MTKPRCKLIGQDGNVFNVIGIVSQTLKRDGKRQEAKEFVEKAYNASSYNEVLILTMEYIQVD